MIRVLFKDKDAFSDFVFNYCNYQGSRHVKFNLFNTIVFVSPELYYYCISKIK